MLELEKRLSWVYLINLVFYIAPFFYINYSPLQYLWMTVALVAFVGCYYWVYRSHSSQMFVPILLMALIASVITPLNYGSIAMFAYVSFFIGFAYNFRQFLVGVAVLLCVLVLLDQFFVKGAPYFLLYGSALVMAIGVFGVLDRARRNSLLKEQRSAEEIKQLATIVERERIARDLHDILGHSLSGIVLKADLADKLLQQQQFQAAHQQLQELAQIARESLSQVRQTVSGYKHKGLAGEVQALSTKLREAGFGVDVQGDIPTLSAREETAVVLILTELVTNVVKHSNGDAVQISFSENQQGHQLMVSDNGKLSGLKQGHGLTGIQERLAALNSQLEWQLSPSRFSFTLPKEA
ncbi:two-component sensor histidine kinase [Rheinheimera mesophila]|uniref:Two-component sensor histidine kinase n=1 Tax=Rheinheimera mesophila TaxID=1547515 RepID=A0A3P3QG93_9GAMM|nr:histidine kinase [Rheinheimera mesophila]KKL01190.1 histidine kinase [Rheinheimera mesophila]RRJ20212.1 two-component sensor histidine kinase [Rheinheimera mesophila]